MTELSLLRRYWWAIPIIVLLAANSVLFLVLNSRTADRDQWRDRATAEERAHKQTVANYRAASAEAQRQAQANVARVKADQAAITERTVHDYQARLAAVDARYERVRAALAARTDLRSPDPAPVSITSDATCRAYGGTSCDGLLAKLRIAERQAWNLINLREWVAQQAAVKANFPPSAYPAPSDSGGTGEAGEHGIGAQPEDERHFNPE
ncbi:hypothetical protein M527_29155 [Sphingobium indicum IP26]|uniref:hypothetical protein n=1 Tax=Sphingobium sp. HDIP04 TaxID=428994 RepID=UPI0003607BF4|nr:hypothetical protein [Sphingobium sp. HDIP04]EPR14184.1 hypothetical protein M527_29155 [Sphingobium indicum IP26]EQB03667.1 hypothetical protein L286_11620 [Sphingobium sp. HDIP04]